MLHKKNGPLLKGPFFLCNPHLLRVTPFTLPTLPVFQTDPSGKDQDDNNVFRWQEFGYIFSPATHSPATNAKIGSLRILDEMGLGQETALL